VKVVAAYGIKGGVGKTSAAVNLAALSAGSGRRTLLWDLDPQGAAAFLLHVKPKVKGGSLRLLTGERDLDDAVRATEVPGLDLLPADTSIRSADLALDDAKRPEKQLSRVLKGVRDNYDVVFLDCPPGLTLLSENVLQAADVLVVPLIPTPLSVRTHTQLLDFIADQDGPHPKVHAFFNLVDGRKTLHGEVRADLLRRTTAVFDGWVPASTLVERMAVTRRPVVQSAPMSSVARAYDMIWEELTGLIA
jgi:chromosome partitioning protein